MKTSLTQMAKDYQRIERAIYYLEKHAGRQPSLQEVASSVGMSEYHFQRVFQRWAGISPKRFLQFLTKEHAKAALAKTSVLETSLETGLSGPGRLHDLFVTCEAMSPGEYKEKGRGLVIEYGIHPSPFGECLIAATERGICALHFLEPAGQPRALANLRREWANATLRENRTKTREFLQTIFSKSKTRRHIRVICRGTNFQIKVWEALLRIPPGTVVSYQTIARLIDCPKAVRAVGSAIGKNAVAYLIPCHRVIRGLGHMGGYRWGLSRKRAMLAVESAGVV